MNTNNQKETINNLPDFSTETISMQTSDELFWNLKESDSIKDFILKRFNEIYYIQIYPKDFSRNIWNERINDIIRRYQHYAEFYPIDIMLFKLNEKSLDQAKNIYEEMKVKYWDVISISKTKRIYIVWFFWWTTWRNNQAFIDKIKLELWDNIISLNY